MNYIGLDVHKKTISYGVKDESGRIQQEGKFGVTRRELDYWMKTVPQPWAVAMEATIFSGWIYDHLLPHAAQIKVAQLDRLGHGLLQPCYPFAHVLDFVQIIYPRRFLSHLSEV
jgi:hypothetical protein